MYIERKIWNSEKKIKGVSGKKVLSRFFTRRKKIRNNNIIKYTYTFIFQHSTIVARNEGPQTFLFIFANHKTQFQRFFYYVKMDMLSPVAKSINKRKHLHKVHRTKIQLDSTMIIPLEYSTLTFWVSQVDQMVKNLPANVGDLGLITGSGRSPEEGMATPSSIAVWRIPGTEEPGGLQTMRSQRVGHD